MTTSAFLEVLGVDAATVDPRNPKSLFDIYTNYVKSIPFNSLPLFSGECVHPSLDCDVLCKKLITDRIGGVCFEHAVVLCHFLRELGFDVVMMGGEVRPAAATHATWHKRGRLGLAGGWATLRAACMFVCQSYCQSFCQSYWRSYL